MLPLSPQDKKFQDDFISRCTPMTVNATLPAAGLSVAWIWASDRSAHVRADYCGCESSKVKIMRNGQDTYILCQKHGFRSLGKASKIRNNWKYAQAGAR